MMFWKCRPFRFRAHSVVFGYFIASIICFPNFNTEQRLNCFGPSSSNKSKSCTARHVERLGNLLSLATSATSCNKSRIIAVSCWTSNKLIRTQVAHVSMIRVSWWTKKKKKCKSFHGSFRFFFFFYNSPVSKIKRYPVKSYKLDLIILHLTNISYLILTSMVHDFGGRLGSTTLFNYQYRTVKATDVLKINPCYS